MDPLVGRKEVRYKVETLSLVLAHHYNRALANSFEMFHRVGILLFLVQHRSQRLFSIMFRFQLPAFHSSLCAKHVHDKAAKWAKSKRPRKSRPSDINRAPVVYAIHSFQKPAEYDISSEPATPVVKAEN
jgi:hypothetical protein